MARFKSIPARERFWPKVDRRGPDECWPWLAAHDIHGYGKIDVDGRSTGAHRFAYQLAVGPVPAGLTLDHLCRNRPCCNPAHLEPVTNRENVLRGEGLTAHLARQTHCHRGHEFTAENTIRRTRPSGGRACRECRRINERARRAHA